MPRQSLRSPRGLVTGCGGVFIALGMVLASSPNSLSAAANTAGQPEIENVIRSPINLAPATEGQTTGNAQKGNPLWAVPLRSLSATRERPLFSPSRRPPAQPVVAAASAVSAALLPGKGEPDHPLLTLVGTIVGKTQKIAIVVDQAAKKVVRLKIGQRFQGWTLRTVEQREAVFENDKHQAPLLLPSRSAPVTNVAAVLPDSGSPTNSWTDGDGRMIAPPTQAKEAVLPATWTDGDGQQISPPPAHNGKRLTP
jgi:general secretion pathway protein N